jgi:hypothetical protein
VTLGLAFAIPPVEMSLHLATTYGVRSVALIPLYFGFLSWGPFLGLGLAWFLGRS